MDNYNDSRIFPANVVEKIGSGEISKNFLSNVFLWMFIGLGASAAVAFYFFLDHSLFGYFINVETGSVNWLYYVVVFAPLGFVIAIGTGYNRFSSGLLTLLFVLFALVNGVSLSIFVSRFDPPSALGCFLSASAMFGIMAFLGYTTNQDLTKFGKILLMGAVGIFFACLINFFLGNNTMAYIISILGVMVFTGLTAYDMQKLKRIAQGLEYENISASDTRKIVILGALDLYLDFINIFLFLLRLFGRRN